MWVVALEQPSLAAVVESLVNHGADLHVSTKKEESLGLKACQTANSVQASATTSFCLVRETPQQTLRCASHHSRRSSTIRSLARRRDFQRFRRRLDRRAGVHAIGQVSRTRFRDDTVVVDLDDALAKRGADLLEGLLSRFTAGKMRVRGTIRPGATAVGNK